MKKEAVELMRKHPYLFFAPSEPLGEETIEGLKDKAHMEKFILEMQITKLIKKRLFSLVPLGKTEEEQDDILYIVSMFIYDLFYEFQKNNSHFNEDVLNDILTQKEEEEI
jgi:hypothetical protein